MSSNSFPITSLFRARAGFVKNSWSSEQDPIFPKFIQIQMLSSKNVNILPTQTIIFGFMLILQSIRCVSLHRDNNVKVSSYFGEAIIVNLLPFWCKICYRASCLFLLASAGQKPVRERLAHSSFSSSSGGNFAAFYAILWMHPLLL